MQRVLNGEPDVPESPFAAGLRPPRSDLQKKKIEWLEKPKLGSRSEIRAHDGSVTVRTAAVKCESAFDLGIRPYLFPVLRLRRVFAQVLTEALCERHKV